MNNERLQPSEETPTINHPKTSLASSLSTQIATLVLALASSKNTEGATLVIAPHNTSNPIESYDILSSHGDLFVTIDGETAANIREITQINFALTSPVDLPGTPTVGLEGAPSAMFDGNLTIKDTSGNILGELMLIPSLTDPSLTVGASGSVITGGSPFSFHFSDHGKHSIPDGSVIGVADPNAPGAEDITWSTAGTDGTIAFSIEGNAVPEPSSGILIATALATGLLRRKR